MRLHRLALIPFLLAAAPAPARIEIRNHGMSPMECQILAAHWYTPLPARLAPPGGVVAFTVAFDPSSGQAIDDAARRLPLETLFCGRAGAAWKTRDTLDLRALAARAARDGVARAACVDAGVALRCAAEP